MAAQLTGPSPRTHPHLQSLRSGWRECPSPGKGKIFPKILLKDFPSADLTCSQRITPSPPSFPSSHEYAKHPKRILPCPHTSFQLPLHFSSLYSQMFTKKVVYMSYYQSSPPNPLPTPSDLASIQPIAPLNLVSPKLLMASISSNPVVTFLAPSTS